MITVFILSAITLLVAIWAAVTTKKTGYEITK